MTAKQSDNIPIVSTLKPLSSKKCVLSQADFENASKKMEELVLNNADSEVLDHVVIRSNLRLSDIDAYCKKHEGDMSLHSKFIPFPDYNPDEDPLPNANPEEIFGDLIATDLPTAPHGYAAGNLLSQIILNLSDLSLRDMALAASIRTRIGRISKEADGSLTPRALRVGGGIQHIGDSRGIVPFPNLVIEVAHQCSLPKLKIELRDWISNSTSVQVAIGIKIFAPQADEGCRLLALVYQRDCPHNPEQVVEFGTNVGDAAGLAITLRLADLYFGVALPDGVDRATIVTVDLADVRDVIARYL